MVADLKDFKVSYEKAVKANLESFVYERQEYNTQYAKYIIEYCEG